MIDLTTPKNYYSKESPCLVTLKEKTLLTTSSSTKPTYHISLDIQGTDVTFHPGDSVAIFAQNDPILVEKLLRSLQIEPEEIVIDPRSGASLTAFTYFSTKVNLSKVSSSLIKSLASHKKAPSLFHDLLNPENKKDLQTFAETHDLIDLFSFFPRDSLLLTDISPSLLPLLPRFYSISSSRMAHAEEVHLLVALASYSYKEETRFGVASHFLCNLATPGNTQIPMYIQPSKHFVLPKDPSANIIMVGPGTGVAPYRAFLQERIATGAQGKNWLFFGGRHRSADFLYKDLWTDLENQGNLRLTTAFSRDQSHKEYVQHKLLEHGQEIFQLLEEGAYFYVCGDATNMAKDVETALLTLIEQEGGLSQEEAKMYYKSLKSSKRYLTDVY